MQILEDVVPVRSGELVDRRRVAAFALGRGRLRPGRQQRGGEIGDRAADRLGELRARSGILLLLDRAHAEHEPGDAIGLVDLQNAVGELDRLLDLAVGEHRQEGAAEQLAVARIAAQRGAVIGRGGGGIALAAGMAGGEIAAGRRGPGKARRRLCPSREHCRPSGGECGHCGHGRTPEHVAKESRLGRLHLADKRPRRGRVRARMACLGPAPQELARIGMSPRLLKAPDMGSIVTPPITSAAYWGNRVPPHRPGVARLATSLTYSDNSARRRPRAAPR